ncbi:MAG: hypothetical protein ACI4PF_01260 [Christensenellales bacterium]
MKLKKLKIIQIITAIILCLFCAFSFVGCVGAIGGYGSSSGSGGSGSGGSGSGGSGGSGSGGSGSGGSGSGGSDPGYITDETINDYNDVFTGAIGVYQIDGTEVAFYDKYLNEQVNFNTLVNRQFDTMATFLYESLNQIYGESPITNPNTFNLSGYKSNNATRQVEYANVIENTNQKIIAKLSSGTLENSNQLNYTNAINGGYDLVIVREETTDEEGNPTYTLTSWEYNTTSVLDGNDGKPNYKWKGKDYFNKDYLKKALAYIYLNQKSVSNSESEISFASDSGNSSLKTYYSSNFNLTNSAITNMDFSTITEIGINNNYLWNVAYFIGYSLIGASNIENSINNQNIIFNETNNIIPLADGHCDEDIEASFESYKGYHIVLKELVNRMSKMSINSSSNTIIYKDYSTNWETTLFPRVLREKYIYYDTIEELSDANSDIDYGDNVNYDEIDFDYVDKGTALKLKKIVLLPYINTSAYKSTSFIVDGMLIGFQAKEDKTYSVKINYNAVYSDKTENGVASVETNPVSDKLTFSSDYKLSEDLTDVSMPLTGKFTNTETAFGSSYDIVNLMNSSFTKTTKDVTYEISDPTTFEIGVLNVYNQLFNNNNSLNITNNYLELEFSYFDSNGNALTSIPEAYLMYFLVYD